MDIFVTLLVIVAVAIFFVLTILEHPHFFRYRSLRFVYRSGLLLYSRTFKVHAQTNKFNIPRWKMEHWMVASGFSSPTAEEDGDGRYILAEFIHSLIIPPPLLLRGKISWDNRDRNVIVRGYVTWQYFSLLVLFVVLLFIPSIEINICGGVMFFIYLICCAIVYLYQAPHFHSIGAKVADHLSSEGE